MLSRRSFLRAVRNRVAAGVLCSGMLTDFLERQVIEQEPEYTYITYELGFEISEEMIEDDIMYRSVNFHDAKWLI